MVEYISVRVAHRDEAAYEQIRWDGERPDWWADPRWDSPDLADGAIGWLFARKYKTFIAVDLDDALDQMVAEDSAWESRNRYRRELFLKVPLETEAERLAMPVLDDQLQLPEWDTQVLGWGVRRSYVLVLLRDLWRGVEEVRKRTAATEEHLKPTVLHLAQALATRGDADLIFGTGPSALQMAPTRLRDLAMDTDNYELLDACDQRISDAGIEREVKRRIRDGESEERRLARERRERRKYEFQRFQAFKGYLRQDDFAPRNARERRALELCRYLYEEAGVFNWQEAADAFEAYVIKHIVNDEPDPTVDAR